MPLSPLPRKTASIREAMNAMVGVLRTRLNMSADQIWHTLEDELPRIYPSIPLEGFYGTVSYGGSEYDDAEYDGGPLVETYSATVTILTRKLLDQRNRDDVLLTPKDKGMYDYGDTVMTAMCQEDLLNDQGFPFLRALMQPIGRTPVLGQSWEGDRGATYEVNYNRIVFRGSFVRGFPG